MKEKIQTFIHSYMAQENMVAKCYILNCQISFPSSNKSKNPKMPNEKKKNPKPQWLQGAGEEKKNGANFCLKEGKNKVFKQQLWQN